MKEHGLTLGLTELFLTAMFHPLDFRIPPSLTVLSVSTISLNVSLSLSSTSSSSLRSKTYHWVSWWRQAVSECPRFVAVSSEEQRASGTDPWLPWHVRETSSQLPQVMMEVWGKSEAGVANRHIEEVSLTEGKKHCWCTGAASHEHTALQRWY